MKAAFICPLYDMKNHFDLALKLYQSKLEYKVKEDIYFIFSNEANCQKFKQLVSNVCGEQICFLVLDESLEHFKSKVTIKKFFGLKKLMNKYDYLGVIDSETRFCKTADFAKVFDGIWQSKNMFKANLSLDGFNILRTCFKTLGIYDNRKLQLGTGHYKYNIWFNEIPVYKCDTLPGFFEWLDQFDINGWGNEWLCFEYYIYAAYLIIEKDFHVIKTKYTSMGGIMEYLYNYSEDKQHKILNTLGSHWSSNPNVTNDHTYLLFHLDRNKNTEGYSYGIPFRVKVKMYVRMYLTIFKDKLIK